MGDLAPVQIIAGCNLGYKTGDDSFTVVNRLEVPEALEKYKIHPEHVAVGDFMRPVRISRTCIDYNI